MTLEKIHQERQSRKFSIQWKPAATRAGGGHQRYTIVYFFEDSSSEESANKSAHPDVHTISLGIGNTVPTNAAPGLYVQGKNFFQLWILNLFRSLMILNKLLFRKPSFFIKGANLSWYKIWTIWRCKWRYIQRWEGKHQQKGKEKLIEFSFLCFLTMNPDVCVFC